MPKIYGFNDFIRNLYGKDDSVFTCVTGPKGAGKTEFNLLQLERIQQQGLGHCYGSNMPIPRALKPPFQMDFIEDFATLETACKMLNPNPERHGLKKYFFFLSEMGKFVPRDQAWRKENIQFIQKLQTVRKYGLSLLSDGIDRIDARVLSPMFFHGEFKKPFSANPKFATWRDYRTGREFTFKDIPRCEAWYDTYYTADFYMEPQTPDGATVPLNHEHEIAFKYLDTGSWKKIGVSTQEGKRCVLKVLRYHRTHCLPAIAQEKDVSMPIEVDITKDSVEVTE